MAKECFTQKLFRALGVEAVLRILEFEKHPQLESIQEQLQAREDEQLSTTALFKEVFQPALDQASEEQKRLDKKMFHKINELANPEGWESMKAECQRVGGVLKELPEQFEAGEALVVELFVKHHTHFKIAYLYHNATSSVDGYLVQVSDVVGIPHNWDEALESRFKTRALQVFQKVNKCGKFINVDTYKDNDFLIISICTQDRKRSQQYFNENDEIDALFYRPPLESLILYEKKTGVLKVRVPQRKKKIEEPLSLVFVDTVLKNAEEYKATLRTRTIAINQLVGLQSLDVSQHPCLASATLVELAMKRGSEKAGTTHILRNHNGVLSELENSFFRSAALKYDRAIIRFEYYVKDQKKPKPYRVKINQRTNNVDTPATDEGHAMYQCLEEWKVISA